MNKGYIYMQGKNHCIKGIGIDGLIFNEVDVWLLAGTIITSIRIDKGGSGFYTKEMDDFYTSLLGFDRVGKK